MKNILNIVKKLLWILFTFDRNEDILSKYYNKLDHGIFCTSCGMKLESLYKYLFYKNEYNIIWSYFITIQSWLKLKDNMPNIKETAKIYNQQQQFKYFRNWKRSQFKSFAL